MAAVAAGTTSWAAARVHAGVTAAVWAVTANRKVTMSEDWFSNPNGESLVMEIPIHTGLAGPITPFGNHPYKDRPQNL
jgi:hypothetical protein